MNGGVNKIEWAGFRPFDAPKFSEQICQNPRHLQPQDAVLLSMIPAGCA